jgi:hypothetical protein
MAFDGKIPVHSCQIEHKWNFVKLEKSKKIQSRFRCRCSAVCAIKSGLFEFALTGHFLPSTLPVVTGAQQ